MYNSCHTSGINEQKHIKINNNLTYLKKDQKLHSSDQTAELLHSFLCEFSFITKTMDFYCTFMDVLF